MRWLALAVAVLRHRASPRECWRIAELEDQPGYYWEKVPCD